MIALIQVLALDEASHRTENGLTEELQGAPRSAAQWTTIARDHPEFFRVGTKSSQISLVARHVSAAQGPRQQLDADFVGTLIEAALDLHDRELARGASWRTAWPTLLSVFLGGFLAVVGSYVTTRTQLDGQHDLQRLERANVAFSRLMGRRFVTTQLLVSRYEALIFSDYHETRWKILGGTRGSLDLQEAQRWMRRSEDLISEIIRSHQALFEDLGTVRATFRDTPELHDRTVRLEQVKVAFPAGRPPPRTNLTELDSWKTQAVAALQQDVDHAYTGPFDDLLRYLEAEVRQRDRP